MAQLGNVNREVGNRKGQGSDPDLSLIDELF
jgi:hypothetical protein